MHRPILVRAHTLGTSLAGLLANAMVGTIFLDSRGKIVGANSRARKILHQGHALSDRNGVLHARSANDDVRLGRLLKEALAVRGRQGASGSMTLERSPLLPRLVVHVNPVGVHRIRRLEIGARNAAALVLIMDPASRPNVDAGLVAETFGLTRAESEVAALLAEGSTVREIAKATFRAESTVRWLVKQIYPKLGISRQADLVRIVLSMR